MIFDKGEFKTNPGSPIKKIYSPVVLDNGEIELKEAGEINTDEEIQSYAESTDLRYILARVNNGDITALTQNKGTYGDFISMPKTYAEVLQLQINSRRVFDDLPIEVKQKFDNDPNKFLATTGTEEWLNNLKDILPIIKEEENIKEDVVK